MLQFTVWSLTRHWYYFEVPLKSCRLIRFEWVRNTWIWPHMIWWLSCVCVRISLRLSVSQEQRLTGWRPSSSPGRSSFIRQRWLTACLNWMSWLSPNYYSPQTARAWGGEEERHTSRHADSQALAHTHTHAGICTLQLLKCRPAKRSLPQEKVWISMR